MTNSAPSSARGWADRFAGGVVFPLWVRREHRGYTRFRREIEHSQFWNRDQLDHCRQSRLHQLLRFAQHHCSFYQQRFRAAGWTNGFPQPGSPAWLALPLLSKRDIQDHGPELEAAGFPPALRQRNQTGGSTGSPLQFYVDRERFATRMASTHRHNAWAGLRPGDWVAQIWGNRLDLASTEDTWTRLRRRLLYRTIELNSSSVAAADWEAYVERLRRVRPRFMIAYARAAAAFAEFLSRRGIDDLRFQAVITSAEVLSAEHRAMIETTLGPVFNRYGCREMSVIASECEMHSGLHVNEEALLVEIVPAPGLEAPWGKIVVTDLLNRSMPLIRYEIGDVGCWQDGMCDCGRSLRRLAQIQGRTTDFLELPDGRTVSGPALTLVVADMPAVRQVQFVQSALGAVTLRLVPGRGYNHDTEEELRRRLQVYLREAVPLRLETVPAIASESSGKYRFVVKERVAST